MKEKFLPIGTICTLKGKNKKTIIVGYYSIEYNGNAIMYDYAGYDYPEGLLLNKKYAFNHSDIKNINYQGYTSEEYEILNKKLLNQQDETKFQNLTSNNFFKNIKFDENGVVVFEELITPTNEQTPTIDNDEYKNNLINNDQENVFLEKKQNPSTIIEDANNAKEWSIFKNIKFDENGTVIEVEEFSEEEINELTNKE